MNSNNISKAISNTTNKKSSAVTKLYMKYEYMASYYASSIFNFERYGLEKEDVVQEFKIKIYTAIIGYAEKWKIYRQTNKYKPIPIEYYIKTAMVNKKKDFIKLFNMEEVSNASKISIEQDGFDFSDYTDISSKIHFENNICCINGVDLFLGLRGRKKDVFSMYLQGFNVIEIADVYPNIDVNNVIFNQVEFIKTKRKDLLNYKKMRYSKVSINEEG
jgi:hypothetical protein